MEINKESSMKIKNLLMTGTLAAAISFVGISQAENDQWSGALINNTSEPITKMKLPEFLFNLCATNEMTAPGDTLVGSSEGTFHFTLAKQLQENCIPFSYKFADGSSCLWYCTIENGVPEIKGLAFNNAKCEAIPANNYSYKLIMSRNDSKKQS